MIGNALVFYFANNFISLRSLRDSGQADIALEIGVKLRASAV